MKDRKYMSSGKLKCPECKSNDIDYGCRAGKNNSAIPASCCNCGYEFPLFEDSEKPIYIKPSRVIEMYQYNCTTINCHTAIIIDLMQKDFICPKCKQYYKKA